MLTTAPSDDNNFNPNVDNLAKYGPTFQTKAIAAMLQKPDFLSQSIDLMNPNFFESDAGRWIVKKTITYFATYRQLPTIEVFKVELQGVMDDVLKTAIKEQLKNVYQRLNDTDLEYVKNSVLDFARNQTLKSAILESADLLGSGEYDQIKILVDKALRAGQPKDFGHDWKKDMEVRLAKSTRNAVATGWSSVDYLLNGGLAEGELGVIAAPSGIGKSWALATIGANALRAGKKVVHYTLELQENYVGTRYDTIFTGIEPGRIPENPDKVRSAIESITGEIIIKYYPTKSVTCNTISAHLQQLMSTGFKPDIILVDYADLLRSIEKSDARYQELGAIYEELRGLAGEFKIPCWTASQTQRSSIQDEVIQADKIAESYSKIMTADVVISLSRKLEDKQNHTGRAHIIKNRFGADGQTLPVFMNTSVGKIEIYDESSTQGIILKKQMQSSEGLMKKTLADRLRNMGQSNEDLLDE
jgi:RecA/RadA recombinase